MSHGADCSRCGRENDCWTSVHCYACQGAVLKKMQQEEDDRRIAALAMAASELIAARQVVEAARRHQQDPAALDDAIRNYDEATK